MAGVRYAIELGNLILECVKKIQELGGNYYKASAEWKQFPAQVNLLKDTIGLWKSGEVRHRDLTLEHDQIERLNYAIFQGEKEKENLEKRAACCGSGWWPLVRMALFPAKLGESIEDATEVIHGALQRHRARKALERARTRMPVSLPASLPASWGNDVLSSVDQIVERANKVGKKSYRATSEWKKFPRHVKQLEATVQDWKGYWENEAADKLLYSDPRLINRYLNEANSVLATQLDLFESNANDQAGLCSRVTGKAPLFPAGLGNILQSVRSALKNVPEDSLGMAINLSDIRYVPLTVSDQICEAIDNRDPKCPRVVLLHGGPGKGKSTFVRKMFMYYKYDRKSDFYNHVFYFFCSRPVHVNDTYCDDLVRCLRSEPPSQKILVILDDVTDADFLNKIISEFESSETTFLVTSLKPDVCSLVEQSRCVKIHIQDIDYKENARKILASHIGLPNHEIPQHLQVKADEMIDMTDSSPLALESLANLVHSDGAHDLSEWEKAFNNLLEALKPKVPNVSPESRPKDFWEPMEQAIRNLDKGGKKLLLLTHACEGPSVPEEIVQFFYNKLSEKFPKFSEVPFSDARLNLKKRQLVKMDGLKTLSSTLNDLGKQISRTWSMSNLVKLYIEKEMKEESDIESMVSSLLVAGKEPDAAKAKVEIEEKFITALCALYLEKDRASSAASTLGILDNFQNRSERRSAIEPIVLLLARPVNEYHLLPDTRHFLMKVFLKYICNNSLDEKSIAHLLDLSIVEPVVWGALREIIFLKDSEARRDSDAESPLVGALVDRLEKGVDDNMQLAALEVIGNLACNRLNRPSIAVLLDKFPGTLDRIVELLGSTSSHSIKTICASILRDLAVNPIREMEVAAVTINSPRLPNAKGPVKPSIEAEDFPPDQLHELIVSHSRLLDSLVNCFLNDNDHDIQVQAAMTLAKVSKTTKLHGHTVDSYPRFLAKLVKALSNPKLALHAAWTLATLSGSDKECARTTVRMTHQFITHRQCLSNHIEKLSLC